MTWLAVWMRAVIKPAGRRALPVWLGTAIVGGTIFGGTGMQPHDLTHLALQSPATALGLAATWLLLFVPVARLLVRDDASRFLRSLPHPAWQPRLLAIGALLWYQLPWLALWLLGEHVLGLALALAFTPIICAVALWRGRPSRTGELAWGGPARALLGIYVRALRRRASDALIRGAGLALLAGGAAGLFVRNNDLDGAGASVLACAVIAVVLAPGWAGALLPLVDAHRDSAWLARSTGASEGLRRAMLAVAIGLVYAIAMVIALGCAAIVVGEGPAAIWLPLVGLPLALGLALVTTRGAVWAEGSAFTAARVVTGAIVASALAVLLLGWLGAAGAPALVAVGVLAVGTA